MLNNVKAEQRIEIILIFVMLGRARNTLFHVKQSYINNMNSIVKGCRKVVKGLYCQLYFVVDQYGNVLFRFALPYNDRFCRRSKVRCKTNHSCWFTESLSYLVNILDSFGVAL